MTVDRVLAKTLQVGQRLTRALLGEHVLAAGPDDSPFGTIKSLLVQPAGGADAPSPAYKADPGPLAIDLFQQTFRDDRLAREVPLTVLHPLGLPPASGYPVVIVSPGLGAHPQATRYLERHLASHGYVVLCPTHQGSDWTACFRRTPLGAFSQRELAVRVSEVGLAYELVESGRLPAHLCRRCDISRTALVGHSFGALTLHALAGVPVQDPSGQEVCLRDSRYRAFISMSPYGDAFPAQRLGMTQQGYASVDRPILFMSGDRDDLWTVGRGPNTHLGPYRWVSTPDRYHLLIGDTRHSDFSEVLGLIKKRTATMVNSTATAFLDAYLRDDRAARDYLRHELPVAASHYQSWAFLDSGEAPLLPLTGERLG
jgi:predicted dienelactone hydrolase